MRNRYELQYNRTEHPDHWWPTAYMDTKKDAYKRWLDLISDASFSQAVGFIGQTFNGGWYRIWDKRAGQVPDFSMSQFKKLTEPKSEKDQ